METVIAYLLPLLVLPLSLYLIFSTRKKGSGHAKKLPPGSMGWPVLGENMELSRIGSQKLVKDRMQKYSRDAFKTSLFGEKIAVLCGLQGNKMVLKNKNKLFKRWNPVSLRKALHPGLAESRSQEPKATFHQNFQYDVLKPDALKHYVSLMDSIAREHLDTKWRGRAVVETLPSIRKYALLLACRVFMNREDWEDSGDFMEPFDLLTNGIISLPINLPGTAFHGAVKGGRVVRRELLRIVEERRREMIEGEDLLSRMVVATNEDGEYMSANMIANVMIGLLTGAAHQLSSFITTVICYLAELPHIYDRVLEGKIPPYTLIWFDLR